MLKIVVAVASLAGLYYVIFQAVSNGLRELRGRRMLKRAKALGTLVVMNSQNSVTAICRYVDFQKAITAKKIQIREEKDPKAKLGFSLQKMRVWVMPTFTFSPDEDRLPVHTGSEADDGLLAEDLVLWATGYERKQVYKETFDEALKCLIKRDKRLLVPFVKPDLAGLSPEAQVEEFGYRSVDDARMHLLTYGDLN